MPAKWLSIAPPVLPAPFARNVERVTVIAAELEFMIAPPYSAAQPSRKVRSEKVTLPPSASTSKRRSSPWTSTGEPGRGVPPSTIVELADPWAPAIVRLSVMSRSPFSARFWLNPAIASSYVPGGSEIVSVPGRAFDSCTAARSVQRTGEAVAQVPSPGAASTASAVLSTTSTTPVEALAAVKPTAVPSAPTRTTTARKLRPRRPPRRRGGLARPVLLSPNLCPLPPWGSLCQPIPVSAPTRLSPSQRAARLPPQLPPDSPSGVSASPVNS